jgi:hypothetical protein
MGIEINFQVKAIRLCASGQMSVREIMKQRPEEIIRKNIGTLGERLSICREYAD